MISAPEPTEPITVTSPSGRWSHRLSPRHAELVLLLALAPNGRGGAELSADLFGSPDHVLAVRAEVSRLRRHLGGMLLHRPYRFADWVDVAVSYPASPDQLLPASAAPAVRRLRALPSPPRETGVA